MTTLYKPVKIESAEQAESLPEGTVAISEEFAPEVFVKDEDSWMGTHGPGAFTNESAVGLEALVPIEAVEEWAAEFDSGELYMNLDEDSARGADGGAAMSRYVTPWEDE